MAPVRVEGRWRRRTVTGGISGAHYPARVVAYRCRACGNRTRFDVVTTSTSRAYHHYSLGGELTVEDATVTATHVESVTCRWCGRGADVEVIDAGALRAGEA
jgi:hypothetical protein